MDERRMTNAEILAHVEESIDESNFTQQRWIEKYVGDQLAAASTQTKLLVVSALIAGQTIARFEVGLEVAGVTGAFLGVIHRSEIIAAMRGIFHR